jgi:hypothetical protein
MDRIGQQGAFVPVVALGQKGQFGRIGRSPAVAHAIAIDDHAQLYALTALFAEHPVDAHALRMHMLIDHLRNGAIEFVPIAMRRGQRNGVD